MGALLRIAWRNLWRGWRRSAICVAAVAIGLSACILLIGWSTGMFNGMVENAVRSHLAHVAVQARGYQANPDMSRTLEGDLSRIDAALEAGPGGPHVAPRLFGDGLVQSSRRSLRVMLVGVVPFKEKQVSIVPGAVVEGRYLDGRTRRVPDIVIGAEMAERLRIGVGDKLVVHVPGDQGIGAFRVVGLYRSSSTAFDRVFAYVMLDEAQRLFARPDGLTQIAVSLDEPRRAEEFSAWARTRLAEVVPDTPVEVLTWQERQPRLAGLLDMMDQFSWILYAVVFVAMAFGIANALLMAVYERIREFGVLRSIGLKGRRLVAMILLEAMLLTLLGTALGLLVGVGTVRWLGTTGIDLTLFSDALGEYGIGTTVYPAVRNEDLLSPVRLAVLTALIAALWPAVKAYRLRPAKPCDTYRSPKMAEPVLEAIDVTKIYVAGEVETRALDKVSLVIEDDEFTTLSGPSGSGKTTLLNMLGTLDRPTEGRVRVAGQDTTEMSEAQRSELRLRKIGFIFQAYNLVPVLSALENVEFVLLLQGVGRAERRRRAAESLDELGLGDLIHKRPNEMSGGQQQRVAVARAIASRPEIVLADEPTANLDSKTAESLLDLMQQLNSERSVTFLFSTHDPRVMRRARRNVHLVDGRIESDEHLSG